jgi:hypothetical protein
MREILRSIEWWLVSITEIGTGITMPFYRRRQMCMIDGRMVELSLIEAAYSGTISFSRSSKRRYKRQPWDMRQSLLFKGSRTLSDFLDLVLRRRHIGLLRYLLEDLHCQLTMDVLDRCTLGLIEGRCDLSERTNNVCLADDGIDRVGWDGWEGYEELLDYLTNLKELGMPIDDVKEYAEMLTSIVKGLPSN